MLKKTTILISALLLCSCNIERSTIVVTYLKSNSTEVVPVSIPTLSLAASDFSEYNNIAIADIEPTVTGGQITFSITPALPTGLTLNPTSGKISGTPTQVLATTTYTLKAENSAGSATATFTMTVGHHYVVNSTGDQSDQTAGDGICSTAGNVCTIRAAAEEVNAGSIYGRITIPNGTYNVGSPIVLSKDVEFAGSGMSTTIIDGNDLTRLFRVGSIGVDVKMSDLTLTRALGDHQSGGAIRFDGGNLTLDTVTISSSTTGGYQGAAALFFMGNELVIRSSVISGNIHNATGCSGACPGAVRIDTGTTKIYDSIFESNLTNMSSGGAIYTETPLEIYRSRFKSNTSKMSGGAIYAKARLVVKQSYFEDNKNTLTGTGGAIYNNGTLLLSVFENNTFYNNRIVGGTSNGGGIYLNIWAPISGWSVKVTNNTFVGNTSAGVSSGGGIGITTDNDLIFTNNIFSSNTPNNCKNESVVVSQGGNIDSGTSCAFNDATDLSSTDPGFTTTTPGSNGGFSPTFIFNNTSPAYSSGVSTDCPSVDQRNLPRSDGACDRGAVELQ